MTDYKTYADIKRQIKDLEIKAAEMELDIIVELNDINGHKLETDAATFSLMSSVKYEYTQELQEKERLIKDKIKSMKKLEEVNGTAKKIKDGWTLRCQLVK